MVVQDEGRACIDDKMVLQELLDSRSRGVAGVELDAYVAACPVLALAEPKAEVANLRKKVELVTNQKDQALACQ